MDDKNISQLQEALKLSPDNIPLRKYLAELLLKAMRFEDAEKEFKSILATKPSDCDAKAGLARASHSLGKTNVALVLMEDIMGVGELSPELKIFYSRLLLESGQTREALQIYEAAVKDSPELKDDNLFEQLKLDNAGEKPSSAPAAKAGGRPFDKGMIAETSDGSWQEGPGQHGKEEDEISGLMEKPDINFSHVGGMEKIKEEIRMKIILPFTNKSLYEAYGKKAGGGILLYGPPGCGKTYLAKATAGEIKASFISVGLNDVLDMWIGQSEQKLHQVFEQARRMKPAVLFFDEVDALGASRSDMKKSAGRHLINQFLSELDGIGSNNEGVLILAATNTPWHLDSAFRRPGRFDRIIFVPPPDEEARAVILDIMLKDKPKSGIDTKKLASRFNKFSGADLRAVIDQAIEMKLKAAMKTGIPEPLSQNDLAGAVKSVRPSTDEWFSTARNYALYANEAGLYDEILQYLGIRR